MTPHQVVHEASRQDCLSLPRLSGSSASHVKINGKCSPGGRSCGHDCITLGGERAVVVRTPKGSRLLANIHFQALYHSPALPDHLVEHGTAPPHRTCHGRSNSWVRCSAQVYAGSYSNVFWPRAATDRTGSFFAFRAVL